MFPLRSRWALPASLSLRRPCTNPLNCLRHLSFPRFISLPERRCSLSTQSAKSCPSCSAPLPTALPVCTKCGHIAPIPQSMTYHELLGVPYEPNPFRVDVSALKTRFRAVQSIVHPDRWVSKPPVRPELICLPPLKLGTHSGLRYRSSKRLRRPCLLGPTRLCIVFRALSDE